MKTIEIRTKYKNCNSILEIELSRNQLRGVEFFLGRWTLWGSFPLLSSPIALDNSGNRTRGPAPPSVHSYHCATAPPLAIYILLFKFRKELPPQHIRTYMQHRHPLVAELAGEERLGRGEATKRGMEASEEEIVGHLINVSKVQTAQILKWGLYSGLLAYHDARSVKDVYLAYLSCAKNYSQRKNECVWVKKAYVRVRAWKRTRATPTCISNLSFMVAK